MEAALDEYVHLCRMLGPWTDWVQGPGGNCSIKHDNIMIVKQSGATLADTTVTTGWVSVSCAAALAALEAGEENLSSLEGGARKPSMEAFLHTLPARIVVHLHPAPLLPLLCDPACTDLPVAGYNTVMIPYMKPGISLARAILSVPQSQTRTIYFLKQHGVVMTGETLSDILDQMQAISDAWFAPIPSLSLLRRTPISLFRDVYEALYAASGGKRFCLKAWYPPFPCDTLQQFIPFTPDIAVFLQEAPLVITDLTSTRDLQDYMTIYGHPPTVIRSPDLLITVGNTQDQCLHIYDILLAYGSLIASEKTLTPLSDADVYALVNWDKEKARKQSAIPRA